MRGLLISTILIGAGAILPEARAGGPADALLKLAPPDSGVTLAVEGLRDHAREIAGSPLMDRLRKLPAVKGWLDSDWARTLERSGREVEEALGVPLEVIRDEILGDAVVFVLKPGPDDRPEEARGLLMALPRDRGRVGPLMKTLDDLQIQGGELRGVEGRTWASVGYSARTFVAEGRPPEFHALLEGGVFAWSNSEEMIRGLIDRKRAGGPGPGG